MKQCIQCVVSGKVQGVWFRAGTKEKADIIGIKGWVRNLQSGEVETKASGTKEQLDQFTAWLKQGPRGAQVESLKIEYVSYEEFLDFRIVY